MNLLNAIQSLLEIKAIPQRDKQLLEEMESKIKSTKEYSEEEYRQIMDLICKYSLC